MFVMGSAQSVILSTTIEFIGALIAGTLVYLLVIFIRIYIQLKAEYEIITEGEK